MDEFARAFLAYCARLAEPEPPQPRPAMECSRSLRVEPGVLLEPFVSHWVAVSSCGRGDPPGPGLSRHELAALVATGAGDMGWLTPRRPRSRPSESAIAELMRRSGLPGAPPADREIERFR